MPYAPTASQIAKYPYSRRWEQKQQVLNKYTVYFGYDSDDDGYKRDDTPIPRRNVGSNQSPITRLLTSVGMRLTVGE